MIALAESSKAHSFSFARAYQTKVSQGSLLALYKANQRPHSRVGIIVSKSIVRKASARNLWKRIFRERFRLHKHEIPGFDLVLLVRKGYPVDPQQFKKELDTLWQRLTASCHMP
jgi:ribonuclease P protein component